MAAAAVPRKSPGSSAGQDTAPASAGYVPIEHEVIDRGPMLVGGDHCAYWLLNKALSAINQRTYRLNGSGRPATGATGLLRVADLQRAGGIWERREVQYAVETVTDPEFPLFRKVDGSEGEAAGLCAKGEYTPRQLYEGFFLVVNQAQVWSEVWKARRKQWREENDAKAQRKRAKEEAQATAPDPEAQVVPIARIRRESGQPMPRAAVPAAVRSRIHEVAPPEDMSPGSEFSLILEGNVLKCQFSLLPVASPAVVATAHHSAQYDPKVPGKSPVETEATAHGGAQCATPETGENPGKRRTDGETTAHACAQYNGNGNGHNGHQANGNGHHSTAVPPDFFSLNDYQDFCIVSRQKLPAATNEELFEVILLCRHEVMLAGLEPDWLTSKILIHGIRQKSITPPFVRHVNYWIKGKGEKKGPLLCAVGNWAREFAATGGVEENHLTPEGQRLVEALERTRGQW